MNLIDYYNTITCRRNIYVHEPKKSFPIQESFCGVPPLPCVSKSSLRSLSDILILLEIHQGAKSPILHTPEVAALGRQAHSAMQKVMRWKKPLMQR